MPSGVGNCLLEPDLILIPSLDRIFPMPERDWLHLVNKDGLAKVGGYKN
jgi:hypothetical protein